jgi:hypothetical protein
MEKQASAARQSEEDRRNFLKSCGRFAATVPPAMSVLLTTSLSSGAIAKSTGSGDVGNGHIDTGNGHVDIGKIIVGDSGKPKTGH